MDQPNLVPTQSLYSFLINKISSFFIDESLVAYFSNRIFIYLSTSFDFSKIEYCRHSTQDEIVDHIIGETIQNETKNVLAFGYSAAREGSGNLKGTTVQCFYVNSIVNLVKSLEWRNLLEKIGDEFMRALLTKAVLFIKVNQNFVQIGGVPLRDLEPETKKNPFTVFRRKMLYAREIANYHGFPSKHFDEIKPFSMWPTLDPLIPSIDVFNSPKYLDLQVLFKKLLKNATQRVYIKQMFLHHCGSSFNLSGDSQFTQEQNCLETLISQSIPYNQVFSFIKQVLLKIIPHDFFVTKKNFTIFDQQLRMFIEMRKYQTFPIVIEGYETNPMKWLQTRENSQRERTTRQILLKQFLYFCFNDLVIPLIRVHFYCTEKSVNSRSKMFYYSKEVWKQIESRSWDSHCDMFDFVNSNETEVDVKPIRYLPKTSTTRFIMNQTKQNAPLRNVLPIVQHETMGKLGSAVLDMNQIHKRFVDWKKKQIPGSEVYMVQVDVRDAYDMMPIQTVYEKVSKIFQHDEYVVTKFNLMRSCLEKWNCRYDRNVFLPSNIPDFLEFAQDTDMIKCVLIDHVNYQFVERSEILELIKAHLLENSIRVGDKVYVRNQGIPQGSVLSTVICSFFYTDLEQNHLQFKNGVLMRFVDDFLFITTVKEEATSFVDKLAEGFPDYGVAIKKEKTWLSFQYKDFAHQDELAWCGYKISSKTLEWSYDFKRCQEIGDLCMTELKTPCETMMRKLKMTISQKINYLILDPYYQSKRMIMLNLFQIFFFLGKKMHFVAKKLDRLNMDYFIRMIVDMAEYAWTVIKVRKLVLEIDRESIICPISKSESKMMLFHGFSVALRRKQTKWTVLLAWISRQLSDIPVSKEVESIIQEIILPENSPDVYSIKF